MIKKTGIFLRFVLICTLWSVFWIGLTQRLVFYIWKFDYVSLNSWKMLQMFWRQNGVIKGFSDYMLFISLLIVLLGWYFGAKKMLHINYLKQFLKPFEYFSKKQIEKYQKESKHIAIKNLVVGEKITVEDLINEKISEEKSSSGQKESEMLRQNIAQKITEKKGK